VREVEKVEVIHFSCPWGMKEKTERLKKNLRRLSIYDMKRKLSSFIMNKNSFSTKRVKRDAFKVSWIYLVKNSRILNEWIHDDNINISTDYSLKKNSSFFTTFQVLVKMLMLFYNTKLWIINERAHNEQQKKKNIFWALRI
jgi:hypothetical protein